jgi:ABC-2 type transport system ATP-binding protein
MTRRPPRATVSGMLTNSLEAVVAARSPARAPAIEIRGVRKSYGGVVALDGVDLTVRRGEVLALLGPNGAGKTTLVEILEGHREADAGAVDVLGFDPGRRERAFRERIGIVLQDAALEQELTVHETIELYAAPYPDPLPADEVADLVGLTEKLHARTRTLSGGQRRRLDVAVGIAGDPELVFLDEPTTGFDPAARRQSWELIVGLRARGRTILLTTHYMEEAQRLADRVAVLSEGRLIALAAPDELGGQEAALVTFRLPPGVDPADLPVDVDGRGPEVSLRTAAPTRDLAPLLSWAAVRGYELEGLTVSRPSLEDVYLKLTEEAA